MGSTENDLYGLQIETGVGAWDPCDRYANNARAKRGPRGDDLSTAQSEQTVHPRSRPVSMNAMGRYAETKQDKVVEKNTTG